MKKFIKQLTTIIEINLTKKSSNMLEKQYKQTLEAIKW